MAANINAETTRLRDMACSDPIEEAKDVMSKAEIVEDEKDFIEGIVEGLNDFAEGRYTVFKDDDDLEAHLMSL
jgi:hypothetical protein